MTILPIISESAHNRATANCIAMMKASARHARATAISNRARSHGQAVRRLVVAITRAGWGY